jgi:hypothetical protein
MFIGLYSIVKQPGATLASVSPTNRSSITQAGFAQTQTPTLVNIPS